MQAFQDSLDKVTVYDMFSSPAREGLVECAALCTKLRSVTLFLNPINAEEFLSLALPSIGRTLLELKLSPDDVLSNFKVPSLALVAQYTGNLLRFDVEVNNEVSLRQIAAANPFLRGVVIRIPPLPGDVEPSVLEKWIVTSVADFCYELPGRSRHCARRS